MINHERDTDGCEIYMNMHVSSQIQKLSFVNESQILKNNVKICKI